ncbi:3-keto-5-aminohexanoate cleavage enzyme [Methylobacterium crusticola]|uniref:3-keto-5-aminohexanoate cleavage enzyme n=1 Tax=Methylobacterium crusticola TaxID=1697972 RepID=A0ABQ4R8E8_9HYPH|nr:3-keto-5-aminohexanoate cleavage protein [Methylobacterium crusticola]GJD54001.1 3-keto-5-aminohexanoate cleavage enzyme [Methylobacterium crusticola]
MSVPGPTAIAVTPTGGRRTKVGHPAIPLTPAEHAYAVATCLEAGACMVHLHVRRADGRHLLDPDAYADATSAIRAATRDAVVVQITSEALGLYAPDEQMAVVRAVRPEAVSRALRELAPDAASEKAFGPFREWLRRESVVPRIILYAPDEAVRLAALQASGVVPFDAVPVLYVLGRYTVGQTSTPSDLLPFLAPTQPSASHWMACAFGRHENACVTVAALLGGHLRVGFENNLLNPDGTTARANAELVASAAATVTASGGRPASAAQLRSGWDLR